MKGRDGKAEKERGSFAFFSSGRGKSAPILPVGDLCAAC